MYIILRTQYDFQAARTCSIPIAWRIKPAISSAFSIQWLGELQNEERKGKEKEITITITAKGNLKKKDNRNIHSFHYCYYCYYGE